MKKALVFVLALALFGFSACGNEGDSSTLGLPSNPTSTEDAGSNGVAVDDSSQTAGISQFPSSEPAISSPSVDVEAIKAENPVGVLTGMASQPANTGFTFSGVTTVMSEDKMFSASGDPVEANVVYSPNVIFERCRYYKATDTSDIFPAMIDEVTNGCDVTLWGEFSGADFIATVVLILEVA